MEKVLALLKRLHADFEYETSDDFISEGLLDSVDLQELFALIETEFGVKLAGTDMTPQNFRNLETIKELLVDHGVNID